MTPNAEEKKEGDYTLIVPLNREKTKTATFYLRDIDETVFLATKALLDKVRKQLYRETVRFIFTWSVFRTCSG